MYCRKCAYEYKENEQFCPNCGNPLNVTEEASPRQVAASPTEVATNQQVVIAEPKKKSTGWIIALTVGIPILVILFIVGIVALIFGAVFGSLKQQQQLEYIDLGGTSIPTLNYVVGEKKLCSYSFSDSTNSWTKEFTYCDNELERRDYNEYVIWLVDNDGYEEYFNGNGTIVLRKDIDFNKVIYININIYEDEISYSKSSSNNYKNNSYEYA